MIFSPFSSTKQRNLSFDVIKHIHLDLKEEFNFIGLHSVMRSEFCELQMPAIHGLDIQTWIAVINQADYVITVDTAQLHCAGGLKKKTLGVFTYINGDVYTKFYPTVKVFQGSCPGELKGCYQYRLCPFKKNDNVPCCNNLSANAIVEAFKEMTLKNI